MNQIMIMVNISLVDESNHEIVNISLVDESNHDNSEYIIS